MNKSSGFSLIELLIVLGLMSMLFVIIGRSIEDSSRYTRNITSRTDLTDDTRTAGQIIADEISRAVYLYPPGSVIDLNSTESATVSGTQSPANRWTVGDATNPIIAFIQAPANRTTSISCSASAEDNCLYFVAYYTVPRSSFNATKFLGQETPQNPDARVLVEYRKRLSVGRLGATLIANSIGTPASIKTELSGVTGRLLADYISVDKTGATITSSGFKVSYKACYVVNTATGGVGFAKSDGTIADRRTYVNSQNVSTGINYTANFNNDVQCPSAPLAKDRDYFLSSVVLGSFSINARVNSRVDSIVAPTMNFAIAPRNLSTDVGINPNVN